MVDKVVDDALRSREMRVFLSSTFNDMDAERTHLVKEVFPRIRAACAERMVGFTEIDLRWGVTEEESKNGETIEICLAEIDRCRAFAPFFIGFLGERYGWIPQEADLERFRATRPESDHADLIRKSLECGMSVTEIEMELAALAESAADRLQGQVVFLLRDPSLTDDLYRQATGRAPDPGDTRYFEPAGGKLDALKDRIRGTPFLAIDGYRSIEEFGRAVEDYLLDRLDRYFPQDEVPTPAEQARLAHAAFRHHRLRFCLPREDVQAALLTAIRARVDRPGLAPVVLTGPSGQGKSAVLADLARRLETARDGDLSWRVIDHYVGADGTQTLDGWLDRILRRLHPDLRDVVGDGVPTDPETRRAALSDWLGRAARRAEQDIGRPVRFVLVVDALDQLVDAGQDLSLLLPEVVGPAAIVVASAADGTAAAATASALELETIPLPALTQEQSRAIIRDILTGYRKSLPDALVAQLAQAPQAGNPLFLQLAIEELRLDARHETLGETLDAILSCQDAAELFLNAFLRDPDYQREAQPDLALQFFAFQAAAHQGLSELELADLLSVWGDPVPEDTHAPRLPQVVMSRLNGVFWPFMLAKEGRRAPMHRILSQAAIQALGEERTRESLHRHFQRDAYRVWSPTGRRAAAEALFQIVRLVAQDPTKRERLRADLANLLVPATLHATHPEILRQALEALGHTETAELAETDWVEDMAENYESAEPDPVPWTLGWVMRLRAWRQGRSGGGGPRG